MKFHCKPGRKVHSLNGSYVIRLVLLGILIAVILSQDNLPAREIGRVSFLGGKWFLVGYDFPWNNYQHDFGTNDLNIQGQYTVIFNHFADLSNNGTHVTRWFMFNDLSQNPLFDKQGNVIGLSQSVFRTLDDALAIARAHHIYLILDFIDGTTLLKKDNRDSLLHSKIFTDQAVRNSFFDKAVKPLLQRYGRDPTILAWSPINEPDYETIGVDAGSNYIGIPYQVMKDFLLQFTRYVHTYTHQMVTIENGPLHFTHFWTGIGFDFYSPHYYDWMSSSWPDSDPMLAKASSFKLDKPIVMGELPSAGSNYTVTQMLDALYNNGYAGALFWSMNVSDQVSNYPGTKASLRAWADVHKGEVNIHSSLSKLTLITTAECSRHRRSS